MSLQVHTLNSSTFQLEHGRTSDVPRNNPSQPSLIEMQQHCTHIIALCFYLDAFVALLFGLELFRPPQTLQVLPVAVSFARRRLKHYPEFKARCHWLKGRVLLCQVPLHVTTKVTKSFVHGG